MTRLFLLLLIRGTTAFSAQGQNPIVDYDPYALIEEYTTGLQPIAPFGVALGEVDSIKSIQITDGPFETKYVVNQAGEQTTITVLADFGFLNNTSDTIKISPSKGTGVDTISRVLRGRSGDMRFTLADLTYRYTSNGRVDSLISKSKLEGQEYGEQRSLFIRAANTLTLLNFESYDGEPQGLVDSLIYVYGDDGGLEYFAEYQEIGETFGLNFSARLIPSLVTSDSFLLAYDVESGEGGRDTFAFTGSDEVERYLVFAKEAIGSPPLLIRSDDGTDPRVRSYTRLGLFNSIHEDTYYYSDAKSPTAEALPLLPATVLGSNPIAVGQVLSISNAPEGAVAQVYGALGQLVSTQAIGESSTLTWPRGAKGHYVLVLTAPGYQPRAWVYVVQ